MWTWGLPLLVGTSPTLWAELGTIRCSTTAENHGTVWKHKFILIPLKNKTTHFLSSSKVCGLYLLWSTTRRPCIVRVGIVRTHWTTWTTWTRTTAHRAQWTLRKKEPIQKKWYNFTAALTVFHVIAHQYTEHTSIFSSMSCFAWSICCGEPRMVNSLKFGSPFGGGWRDISTNAPVCWLMDLTFSPPLPMTSPHLWAGMEKVISPPGGPQFPWPLPRPLPPGGIPAPGPGGPCRWGNVTYQV